MTLLSVAGALALGCLSAGLHLGLTYLRTRQVAAGRPILALVSMPLALVLPSLVLFAAARQSVGALGVALAAFVVTERVILHRARAQR